MRLRVILLAAALAAVLAPVHALAQSPEAEALFTDGERLLAAGKVAEACDAFAASNRIEPRAGTLINLGSCRETNKQYASAWSAFKDALARVKDPKKKQIAEAKVKALEPRLSYFTISVADEVRIDGLVILRDGKPVDTALWNRAIPVDGGRTVVTAKAPGHEEWSTTVEIKPEKDKVSIEVPTFKELAKLAPPPTPAPPAPAPPVEDEPETPSAPMSGKRKLAIGLAVVGVGAAVGGVLLGRSAKALEKDALALCPDPDVPCMDAPRANDLLESGASRALLANVAFGVAAGATVTAVVLWITGAPRESQVAVTPRASGDSVGVAVSGRF